MSTLRVGNITATGGTGTITVPTGNQIVQAGAVLQVVSASKTDTFSSSAATPFVDVTGLSVTITPSSTSSKILVIANGSAGSVAFLRLMRNSTEIHVGSNPSNRIAATTTTLSAASNLSDTWALNVLDSPNTTSAVTYKIQGRGEGGVFHINRASTDTDAGTSFSRTASSITVMEIAG
jgi:hypothetical protein